MQDDQHELEPGAHLLLGQRDVGGKHDVVGLDLLGHGLVEVPDLVALVGAPGHEPFGFLPLLARVYALGGQVMDGCGGAGSWGGKTWEASARGQDSYPVSRSGTSRSRASGPGALRLSRLCSLKSVVGNATSTVTSNIVCNMAGGEFSCSLK